MFDPNSTIPEADREAAYTALLKALARDEPDALRRVTATVEAEHDAHESYTDVPAATLARAWLAATGQQEHAAMPQGLHLFTFTYPAHVYFEIVTSGKAVAQRQARRAMALLLGRDEPLGNVAGRFPSEPSIQNVTVWLGSSGERKGDTLELELME